MGGVSLVCQTVQVRYLQNASLDLVYVRLSATVHSIVSITPEYSSFTARRGTVTYPQG
jgi:hypothetical protein